MIVTGEVNFFLLASVGFGITVVTRMKQLSVVPTAWIADQMETGHHGNQMDVSPTNHKSLVACGYLPR